MSTQIGSAGQALTGRNEEPATTVVAGEGEQQEDASLVAPVVAQSTTGGSSVAMCSSTFVRAGSTTGSTCILIVYLLDRRYTVESTVPAHPDYTVKCEEPEKCPVPVGHA